MKNKWMKKVLVLMMCGALAVPAAGMAQPMVAQATEGTPAVQTAGGQSGSGTGAESGNGKTATENLADAKKNALDQLEDYYDTLKTSVPDDKKSDFEKAKNDARTVIENMRTSEQVTAYLTKATAKLDTFVPSQDAGSNAGNDTPDTTPTTTNNNIMVGGNWVTPVANAGQQVNVVLPVVNMGRTRVKNVVVTPVISEDAAKWPFEIETSNYSQTIDRLPGTDDGGSDMDRRRELTWTLRTRKDAPSGYMPISFNVTFENDDKSLTTVTLTSYVKVVGTTGISADGKSSTPRVIVTGFSTSPETVHAGDTFTLTLHMQNTSKATAVKNMVFDIQAASESTDTTYVAASFLPTAGSSTVFVDKIAAGANKDISIELEARSDLAQKPYVINVKMNYEDESVNAYENTASVSIPVRQEARIDTSSVEVTPQSIEVGGEANVSFSLYNIGKTKLYNASVKFQADSVTGGDTYLGNIDPGATGSVDAYLSGAAATTDDGKVKILITFEDESGEKTTIEKEMELYVTEMMDYDDGMTDDGMYDDGSQSQGGFKIWYVLIPLVIVIAVVAAFLIIRKKKAKKAAALLEADDLDDLEDVDLGDDTEETDDVADTSEDGKEKE